MTSLLSVYGNLQLFFAGLTGVFDETIDLVDIE